MHHTYRTHGTCSSRIDFDLAQDGTVHDITFTNGCNGNLKAIGTLVEGWPASDVAGKLRGLSCGGRPTSCGDQLARAIDEALAEEGRQAVS